MNQDNGPKFAELVQEYVKQIPEGMVMTYGQIAALSGNAGAARIVGGLAHFGNPEFPWQRVVNKNGGLASGYPGGRKGHKKALEAEGVFVSEEYKVNIKELIWHPNQS